MSKIKTGGLDQYGAGPFGQQPCGTAGVERDKAMALRDENNTVWPECSRHQAAEPLSQAAAAAAAVARRSLGGTGQGSRACSATHWTATIDPRLALGGGRGRVGRRASSRMPPGWRWRPFP